MGEVTYVGTETKDRAEALSVVLRVLEAHDATDEDKYLLVAGSDVKALICRSDLVPEMLDRLADALLDAATAEQTSKSEAMLLLGGMQQAFVKVCEAIAERAGISSPEEWFGLMMQSIEMAKAARSWRRPAAAGEEAPIKTND